MKLFTGLYEREGDKLIGALPEFHATATARTQRGLMFALEDVIIQNTGLAPSQFTLLLTPKGQS